MSSEQRNGLLLIAGSLVAIGVTLAVFLDAQIESRRERSRAQGASLARLLSSIPYERVLPRDGAPGALRVARTSQSDPDFLYVSAVGLRGEPLAEESVPGTPLPQAQLGESPASWVGERVHESVEGTILEFYGPLLADGERVGEVRVGFREPGLGLLFESASFVGAVALPIFLLAMLGYGLMRREMRPLAEAVGRLDDAISGDGESSALVAVDAGQDRFSDSFQRFVQLVETRMADLESEKRQMRASSQVIGYQKSRIESVLDTLPDATVVCDEEGVVTFANERVLHLLGISPEEAVGQPLAESCQVPEVQQLLAAYRGSRASLRRSEVLEFQPLASEETRLAVSVHPLLAPGDERVFGGTVVVFQDVTAEVTARGAQGDFIAHVGHELKTPLNVIAMYSEALLGEDGDSASFRMEACNTLRDEVERMSMLVTTLLTISKIESGTMLVARQRIRLEEFLADVLGTVGRSGAKLELHFELDLASDVPVIYADKELMRVALNNLLTNAVKYNEKGGRVVLGVDRGDDALTVFVRDTGLGVPEGDLSKIFEKFYRSEDPELHKRGGHGLGLALVAEIASLHGAEVRVQSAPGEGSTFSIVFPHSVVLSDEEGA